MNAIQAWKTSSKSCADAKVLTRAKNTKNQRLPQAHFPKGIPMLWLPGNTHSAGQAVAKDSRSCPPSRHKGLSHDFGLLNIEKKQVTPRHEDRGHSHSTNDNKLPSAPPSPVAQEREQHLISNKISDLSSMRVLEHSSNICGYDGDSKDFGIIKDKNSAPSGIRPKGKEPAVQGCGYITTATFVKMVTLLVMLYFGGLPWVAYLHHSAEKLCAFHNKTICTESVFTMGLMTISRLTAGALFPSLACCVLSKCYATRYFLHHSWLSLVVSVEPAHTLHTYSGTVILLCGCVHGVTHVARMVYDERSKIELNMSVTHSGLVSLVLLLPIAIPMLVGRIKSRASFEFRKMLHMLFIPFTIALCFHTPTLRLFCAILLIWYILDRLYFTTRMTFFIEQPVYKPVGRGTFVRFNLPPGYKFKVGAYVQVNCPAISAYDWHPFSLFPVPGPIPRAGFHVEAVGDWTQELFRLSLKDPYMPLWITAAQPSILEKSIYFDNVVLVCTGAGITPAVSLTEMFAKKKNVHLLWLSREASMIAMFEKQLRQVKSTVHLTGKPSAKTRAKIMQLLAPCHTEVVFTVPRASTPPSRRSSSQSSLTAIEAGAGELLGEPRREDYGNNNFMEGVARGGCFVLEDFSRLRGFELGSLPSSQRGSPSVLRGDDDGEAAPAAVEGSRHGSSRTGCHKKARGVYPVSVNFGRPDVGRFIAETVKGTAARPEWADEFHRAPVSENVTGNLGSRTRMALERLSTNQRISKRDLMSADLTVVKSKSSKGSLLTSDVEASEVGGGLEFLTEARVASADPSTWLVLYCGANLVVEKAVASTCNKLKVTWRKEYFSAW